MALISVRPRTLVGLMAGLALAAVAVSAHHSQSAYEPTRTVTIEGTLEAVSWSNPHSLFFVDGHLADDASDAVQRWSIEGPNPRSLEGAGFARDDAKVGEAVTMEGRPRRDGKPDMLVVAVTTAAGKHVSFRNDGRN